MKKLVPVRAALADIKLLGRTLDGDSWRIWRVLLLAAFGENLTPNETEVFKTATNRSSAPLEPVSEFAAVVGRRGGKSRAMAVLATYIAGLCDHTDNLAPGERGLVMCIAPDQRQSRILLDYIEACFQQSPILSQLLEDRIADTLRLTNGIDVEVRSASFRRVRGVTSVAVLVDEVAFLMSEGSVNPDTEILAALRPSLATTRGPLIIASSPYAKRGELFDIYSRHFGPDGDPSILVAKGPSRVFNPSLPQSVVDKALARDHAAAMAEYMAEFRSDIEGFISLEAVLACVETGVRERPPVSGRRYFAFADPAGGSGKDSMTLAIAHGEDDHVVIDALREITPPFSPEHAVDEFATTLRSYGISSVTGDRWAGEWPREQFRKRGIRYVTSEHPKSSLYLEILPSLNAGKIRLLDHGRSITQIVGLERRHGRSGKDTIDHAPNSNDDIANVIAGVIRITAKPVARPVIRHYAIGPAFPQERGPRTWSRMPGISAETGLPKQIRFKKPIHLVQ